MLINIKGIEGVDFKSPKSVGSILNNKGNDNISQIDT